MIGEIKGLLFIKHVHRQTSERFKSKSKKKKKKKKKRTRRWNMYSSESDEQFNILTHTMELNNEGKKKYVCTVFTCDDARNNLSHFPGSRIRHIVLTLSHGYLW